MQVTSRLFSNYIKPIPLVAADVLSEVEGLDKTFKFAKSFVDLHAALSSHVSESLEILGTLLKGCSEVMLPFQFFKVIRLWLDVKNKSWAGVAALVNITVLTTIGLTKFLAKLKLLDLAHITQKLGEIPVLGTIIQIPLGVFVIGANGFTMIDTTKNLNKNKAKLKIQQPKLSLWKNRCTQWNARDTTADQTSQFQTIYTTTPSTERQQKKLELLINACNTVASRVQSETPNVTSPDVTKAYLEFKLYKWQNRVTNLKVERSKFRFSIVVNICIIVSSILGIAATSFGIAALGATSMPMLALGLFIATIALSKIIYDKVHKTPKAAPKLTNLQDEIFKEYKYNKRINGIKKGNTAPA